MGRKDHQVPVYLNTMGIKHLPDDEISVILRGADDLIFSGGRTLLAKILKGSREKKILELDLDQSPVYGYYKDHPLGEVKAKIDWMILNGYLDIEYDYRLPLLVYTQKGWDIEKHTYTEELIQGFDKMLESGETDYDMTYLKDKNRELIMLLLDKLEEKGEEKYIPILEAWKEVN